MANKGDRVDERDEQAARSKTERFEAQRGQLRAVAFRMLGSAAEADDAVQEAWLRLSRADAAEVRNLGGWLRTVVTRICLDILRARESRREDLVAGDMLDRAVERSADARAEPGRVPEDEALLADSVSRALMIVLDTLTPAERIAFVLHDMFAVPFDQIAPMVDRKPESAKKLASRARAKVRGGAALPGVRAAELARNRRVVAAFLEAARLGDLAAILAVLAPDVVRRADPAVLPPGAPTEVRGAGPVADSTVSLGRRAALAELMLIDGEVGAVIASGGRMLLVLTFVVVGDRVASYDVIADPLRFRQFDFAVLPSGGLT